MRFHWQQFSPREKEALLRHFILQRNLDSPVTAESICTALKGTHLLSCSTPEGGVSIYRFVSNIPGARSGMAESEDVTDGIYKAALRTFGVDIDDGTDSDSTTESRAHRRAGRPVQMLKKN